MTPDNRACPRCSSFNARHTDVVDQYPQSDTEKTTNIQNEFTCLECGMSWWEWDKVPDYMKENQ